MARRGGWLSVDLNVHPDLTQSSYILPAGVTNVANLQAGNFIRGYTEFWNITFERQLGLGWTGGGPFLPLKHERVGTMTYDIMLKAGEYFTGQCRAAPGEVEEAVGEQGDGDDTSRGARAGK